MTKPGERTGDLRRTVVKPVLFVPRAARGVVSMHNRNRPYFYKKSTSKAPATLRARERRTKSAVSMVAKVALSFAERRGMRGVRAAIALQTPGGNGTGGVHLLNATVGGSVQPVRRVYGDLAKAIMDDDVCLKNMSDSVRQKVAERFVSACLEAGVSRNAQRELFRSLGLKTGQLKYVIELRFTALVFSARNSFLLKCRRRSVLFGAHSPPSSESPTTSLTST